MASARVDIAIVGGGVIGAACAWFLARRGARPLVIEGASVAHAASGRAAGLLSPLMPPADRETAAIAAACRLIPKGLRTSRDSPHARRARG